MDFQGEGVVELRRDDATKNTQIAAGRVTGRLCFDGPSLHIKQRDKEKLMTIPVDAVERVDWSESR